MKRTILAIALAILMVAMCIPTFAAKADTTITAPVVDGTKDAAYDLGVKLAIDGKYDGGHKPSDTTFGDSYWYVQDGKLYVYVEVKDTTTEDDASKDPWCRDRVEFLFETGSDFSAQGLTGVEQYAVLRMDPQGDHADGYHMDSKTSFTCVGIDNGADGYIVEASWDLADVQNVNGLVYVFIAINDGPTGGEIWSSHNSKVQNGTWSGGNWQMGAYDALSLDYPTLNGYWGDITVDGTKDEAYDDYAVVLELDGKYDGGHKASDTSFGKTYWLVSGDTLYLYVEVYDTTDDDDATKDAWCRDEIEIFFETGSDFVWGSYTGVEQYRIVRKDATILGDDYHATGANSSFKAAIGQDDANGYTAEFSWKLSEIKNANDGSIKTFIAVNDGPTGGEIWSLCNPVVEAGAWNGGNWQMGCYGAFSGNVNTLVEPQEEPTPAPVTGDVVLTVSALALVAAGAVVFATKKANH